MNFMKINAHRSVNFKFLHTGAAWHLIKEWAPMLQTVFGPHAATLVCCSPTAADSLAVANTSMEFLNRRVLN